MAMYRCPKGEQSVELVPWSTGTIEQIAAMVDAYYDGTLSLEDIKSVWTIGQGRKVSLSAMPASGLGDSHIAQDQTFVLMNWGGKKLSSDHTTEVLAIVGQRDTLSTLQGYEDGQMNSTKTNVGGWDSCARRTWCNNVYRAAIPADFRALFKQFDNVTASGNSAATVTSADYFALPSEKEVFGSTTYSNPTAEAANSQFEYYVNRSKVKKGALSGVAVNWWERSPRAGWNDSTQFCSVDTNGYAVSTNANGYRTLSPFGCI